MHTALACIPCLINQTLNAARYVSTEAEVHEKTMREVLSLAADLEYSVPPPAIAKIIHERIRSTTGIEDPYREAKDRANQMVFALLPELVTRVRAAEDPFETAVRFAIAGNVIDLGVYDDVDRDDLRAAMDAAVNKPLYGNLDEFRSAVADANKILYIADNAGEIVCDRVLIEQLKFNRVTVAVRGGPVINDATIEDARATFLTDVVKVIDTGSAAPGVLLDECSDEFRQAFCESDVIISKGQGNYEGLSEVVGPIFFLLKIKCRVLASQTGRAIGSHLLVPSSPRKMLS